MNIHYNYFIILGVEISVTSIPSWTPTGVNWPWLSRLALKKT